VLGSAYASADNVGASWFGLCELCLGFVAALSCPRAVIVELFGDRRVVAAACTLAGCSCPVCFLQSRFSCGLRASLRFCSISGPFCGAAPAVHIYLVLACLLLSLCGWLDTMFAVWRVVDLVALLFW